MAGWTHIQELDYEQLPFKCRYCHEHGHFAKNYMKKIEEQADKTNDQWTVVQKIVRQKEGNGKGSLSGAPRSFKPNQEKEVIPKGTKKTQTTPTSPTQENLEQIAVPPSIKEGEEATQVEPTQGSPSNPSYADVTRKNSKESSGSSEDETFERPSKRAGRKSHKELREEEVERLKVQGSQATIEMTMGRNTRPRPSKGGHTPSLK